MEVRIRKKKSLSRLAKTFLSYALIAALALPPQAAWAEIPEGRTDGSTNALAIVSTSSASGESSISIGDQAVSGEKSVAMGYHASADTTYSVAIGHMAEANYDSSVAIGSAANAGAASTVAIGVDAAAAAQRAVAVGDGAKANMDYAVAIGNKASVTAANSVALGYNSVASEANTVSVGGSGTTRRIVNVAGGTADTDAATVGQLTDALGIFGNGAAVSADDGSVTRNNFTYREDDGFATVQSVFNAIDEDVDANETKITAIGDVLGGESNGYRTPRFTQVEIGDDGDSFTVKKNGGSLDMGGASLSNVASVTTGGVTMSGSGIAMNQQKITGLSDGAVAENSTDAVTGGQLYSTNQNVAENKNKIERIGGVLGENYENPTFATVKIGDDAGGYMISKTDGGLDMDGAVLSNLAAGTIAEDSTDAVTGGQIYSLRDEYVRYDTTAIAIGSGVSTFGREVTAIGVNARAGSSYSTAVGYGAVAEGISSTAVGYGAEAAEGYSTVLGHEANTDSDFSTAVGYKAQATGVYTSAFGADAVASNYSSAFGYGTNATGQGSSAFGNGATAYGQYSAAFGNASEAGDRSSVFGNSAIANSPDSVAIGYSAIVNQQNSVALGVNSVADQENAVSVGNGNNDLYRRIIYVADGTVAENSSDAVTGGQLYSLGSSVQNALSDIGTRLDKLEEGWTFEVGNAASGTEGGDGTGTGTGAAAGGGSSAILPGDTLSLTAGENVNIEKTGDNSYTISVDAGSMELDDGENITVVKNETTTTIEGDQVTISKDGGESTTIINYDGISINNNSAYFYENSMKMGSITYVQNEGLDMGGEKITGLADGNIAQGSTDAVTGNQLWEAYRRMGDMQEAINVVGAHAAALSGLHPIQYNPYEPTTLSAAVGTYRDEYAVAVGVFHYVRSNVLFNLGASICSDGDVMGRAGVSFAVGKGGRKKPELARDMVGMQQQMIAMQAKLETLEEQNKESEAARAKLMEENRRDKEIIKKNADIMAQNEKLIKELMKKLEAK